MQPIWKRKKDEPMKKNWNKNSRNFKMSGLNGRKSGDFFLNKIHNGLYDLTAATSSSFKSKYSV